jgi:hypothetical protein
MVSDHPAAPSLHGDGRMNNDRPTNRRNDVYDRLHPAVYVALVGSVAWFSLAIWGFASDSYTDWLLVVVCGFWLIAVSIPAILFAVKRGDRSPTKTELAFRDWISSEFASWTGSSKASNAAVEILLPMGAAAIGMTAIAIIFAVAEHAA